MRYRICYAASTMIGFEGSSDWMDAPPDKTQEQVENDLNKGGQMPEGLEEALNLSGFEWWVEVQ